MAKFDVRSGGLSIEEVDANEPEGNWPWRELVEWLKWLARLTPPDIANASSPRRRAIGVFELPRLCFLRGFGSTFQRGSRLELVYTVVFSDADCAFDSKASGSSRSVFGGAITCAGGYVCRRLRTQ